MRRTLASLVTFAIAITVLFMPPLTRALPQSQSGARNPQARKLPSGKIVDSYRRGDPGSRPGWVDTALARSLAHLRSERDALELVNPDTELSLFSAVRDDLGQTHVRLDQVYHGVPVFNAQIIAHLDADSAQPGRSQPFTTGRLFKDARLVKTNPRLDSSAALAIAKRAFGHSDNLERENVELVILSEAAKRSGSDASGAVLTYKVELYVNDAQSVARHFYFIDAHTGRIVWDYDGLETGSGHGLYSGNVGIGTVFNGFTFQMRDPNRTGGSLCGVPGIITSDSPTAGACTPLTDSDDNWGASMEFDLQSAAVDAHYFSELTFDYFLGFHGKNSVDGAGKQMCNRMRNNSQTADNAFWDGVCTNYGTGSAGRHWTAADVVGHEYTHGVTQFTNGPAFNNSQSGGSNESFSDIFGTMVEFFWGTDPDYRIAEDVVAGGIRIMSNPRLDNNSIDHLSQFFEGMNPHFSSGLQNVTFYLLAESGNHPSTGVFVKKIGRNQAASIYFRALDIYLTPTATFANVRQACELATRDLYSTGNPYFIAVRKSWFSAGVGSDVPFNSIDTSTGFVTAHYRDFFLREPDTSGLNSRVNSIEQCGVDAACEDGMRLNTSLGFWESSEFQSRGDVQASGLLTGDPSHPFDNHQFVRWCYLNYLRREPDGPGWSFWETELNNLGDYNAIIRAFLCSQEYRERFGPN